MMIKSPWVRARMVDGLTVREKRVRVEINLDDCDHVSTEAVHSLLERVGVPLPRQRVKFVTSDTRPLSKDIRCAFLEPFEWSIPAAAFVQIQLEYAARHYFSGDIDFDWRLTKKDAKEIGAFRDYLVSASELFNVPARFSPYTGRAALVMTGLFNAQSPALLREGESLFYVPALQAANREERKIVRSYQDLDCLREALSLLVKYAERAAKWADVEAAENHPSKARHKGNTRLRHYVHAVCFIWASLGLAIRTSVREGSAGGPLVRFVRGALSMIEMERSEDATRALIRRT